MARTIHFHAHQIKIGCRSDQRTVLKLFHPVNPRFGTELRLEFGLLGDI